MVTAADLRAEVARRGRKLYEIAPRVGLHPNTLGQVLRERAPLTPDLARRVMAALEAESTSDR